MTLNNDRRPALSLR